ncbi:hypothetical protein COY95_00875, partial [Candidatus Woesearchaeota archaeon CG_4_10_14_0_8_um_filter_47_5]
GKDEACPAPPPAPALPPVRSGGGGGRMLQVSSPPSCISQWNCSSWSSCINNVSARTCDDINACNISRREKQACTVLHPSQDAGSPPGSSPISSLQPSPGSSSGTSESTARNTTLTTGSKTTLLATNSTLQSRNPLTLLILSNVTLTGFSVLDALDPVAKQQVLAFIALMISGALLVAFVMQTIHMRRKTLLHSSLHPQPITLSNRSLDIVRTLLAGEQNVVTYLLENNGGGTQASAKHATGLPLTSLHRYIQSLETKNILVVEKIGKMKKIRLSDWFLGDE